VKCANKCEDFSNYFIILLHYVSLYTSDYIVTTFYKQLLRMFELL